MKKYMILITVVWISASILAQEEEKKDWTNALDLSLVGTGGNSESTTFGFNNHFNYKKGKGEFNLKIGAIRAESTSINHFAVGYPNQYDVIEESETVKTDEKYFINSKYSRKISEKYFWFLGLDWDRNEFAGIVNRSAVSAGFGNKWVDSETHKFSTSYGLQYTQEDLVFEPTLFDDSYGSIVVSYDLFKKVGDHSSFDQDFDLVSNLEESGDFRVVLKNGFSTSLTDRLALKIGLQFNYDSEPAFKAIDLMVDGQSIGELPYELDSLDYIFTTSLVVNF